MQEMQVQSLGQEEPLEKKMATHSSILAWKVSWTEESGRLQSIYVHKSDMTERLNTTVILSEHTSWSFVTTNLLLH